MGRLDGLLGASEQVRTHFLRMRKIGESLNVAIFAWRQILTYHQAELPAEFHIGAGMCFRQEQDALNELLEVSMDIEHDVITFSEEARKMLEFLAKEIKKLPDDFEDTEWKEDDSSK